MFKKLNFSWIIPNILAGSSIPNSREDIEWLVNKEGIDTIISLTEDNLTKKIKFFRVLKSELHIKHYHIPTVDGTGFYVHQFQKICKIFQDCVTSGNKLLVHCEGGYGRTSTVIVAIWMYFYKKSMDESIKEIKNPKIRPQAIFTKLQIDSLKQWEEILSKN